MTKIQVSSHIWIKELEWMKCSKCGAAYRHGYGNKMPSEEQDNHCYETIYPSMNEKRNRHKYMVWEILRRYPDRKWRFSGLTRDVMWYFDEETVYEGEVRSAIWSLATDNRLIFDSDWYIVANLDEKEREVVKNLLIMDPRRMSYSYENYKTRTNSNCKGSLGSSG